MLVGGSKVITNNSIKCNSFLNTALKSLNENIKQFWQIDSYETVPESQLISSNEKRSLELLGKTTKFVNGHFQVGLLWKDDFPILQNNRECAIQRFKCLEKRFSKNPEFFNMYKSQNNDYITSGQAKLLSPEEKNNTSSITNYIPHHGVLNINKPDRARVVFDASGKINKTFLNDNLLPGVDLLNNLVTVITKFRNGKYAIIGVSMKPLCYRCCVS